MKLRRQSFLALALIACLVSASCSKSQLDKAAKASADMARYTGEAITLVKTMYESGLITIVKKDQIATQLLSLSNAGKEFNDLVMSLHTQYADGNVPPSAWAAVSQNFDHISRAFVNLLDVIVGVNPEFGNSKAMRIIRAAVLTLAVLLQSNGLNTRETRRWVNA